MSKTTKKTTKKRATRKKAKEFANEPVTIAELQSWLSGVVEFQAANWTPNKEQWETVMNKIHNLVSDVPNHPQQSNPQNQGMVNEQQGNQQLNQPVVNPETHRKSFIAQAAPADVQNQPNQRPNNQVHEQAAPADAPLPPGKQVLVSNKRAPTAREILPKIGSDGQPESSFK